MQQNPIEQFVNAIVGAFAGGLGEALGQIAIFIFSVLAMSPAIGSVLLVIAAAHWPIIERRALNAGIAGVVLTVFSGLLAGLLFGGIADSVSLRGASSVLPYVALIAIAGAIWFHYRERASFTRIRAVGVVCAVATPIAALLIDQL
ncbi:MAG: hypothetical protein KBA31_10490 [Alphaproteobacteria bacterium]|nr:hypothetical protein [Alphaproteobacteria bacterium]